MDRHLIVFVRAPRVGAVKSRLAADIGAVAAWKFQRDAIRSLLARVGADPAWRTWLALAPSRARGRPPWLRRLPRLDQGRGDLGARMARALVAAPRGPVVLVGGDIPELGRAHVERAFRALARAEVVVGPADDGGFWLVGLRRRPRPPRHIAARMFAGVRWSTPHALADLLANLRGRADVALADTLSDVDTGADHARWRARGGSRSSGYAGRPRPGSSRSRGRISTKLQGRKRLSSCHLRMSSQPSRHAPGDPGRANR